LALAAALAAAAPAFADPVEDFYRGKTVNIYIGTGEGAGAMTSYPQALADILGRHLPGHPAFVLRNMPGAGGFKAAMYMQSVAPQDGTAWGFITRGFVRAPLLKAQGADFDPVGFQWIGSPSREPTVATVWTEATKVRTLEDATREEVVYGATSLGTDTGLFPVVMNALLGTRFKVVPGYKSSTEVDLAMQRGEAQGKIWTWGSLKSERSLEWLRQGKVKILAQIGLDKPRDLPDVPLALEAAKSPADRQLMELVFSPVAMGYPSFMGPGVPRERVAAMRKAFQETVADPEFAALLAKQNLALDPVAGEELDALTRRLYATPKDVVARAREIVPPS
jgi:tripartite-type tricarboxylate transporter receptor subunit TctC